MTQVKRIWPERVTHPFAFLGTAPKNVTISLNDKPLFLIKGGGGDDGGTWSGALRSDTFPNSQFRVAVGDVAVLRSVATALPKCSKQGGWRGLMVVGQSGALRSDT